MPVLRFPATLERPGSNSLVGPPTGAEGFGIPILRVDLRLVLGGVRMAQVRLLLAAMVIALGAAGPARAQVGVYATFTPLITRNPVTTQTTLFGGTNKGNTTAGLGLGIYGDIPLGPVGLGADLRGLFAPSASQLFFGPRIALRHHRVSPYFEVLVGAAKHRNAYNNQSADLAAAFIGGADLKLRDKLDWRVIDVQVTEVATGITTDTQSPHSTITGISTGIVFRF